MARSDRFRTNQTRSQARGTRSRSFDAVLSLPVTVKRDGAERRVTAEQAFLLDLRIKTRRGDVSAAELWSENSDVAMQLRMEADGHELPLIIRRALVRPGSVSRQLECLRMVRKLDRHSTRPSRKLEPWLVQAALARLGEQRLTIEEQRTVYATTRTPSKVQWPDWWEIKG